MSQTMPSFPMGSTGGLPHAPVMTTTNVRFALDPHISKQHIDKFLHIGTPVFTVGKQSYVTFGGERVQDAIDQGMAVEFHGVVVRNTLDADNKIEVAASGAMVIDGCRPGVNSSIDVGRRLFWSLKDGELRWHSTANISDQFESKETINSMTERDFDPVRRIIGPIMPDNVGLGSGETVLRMMHDAIADFAAEYGRLPCSTALATMFVAKILGRNEDGAFEETRVPAVRDPLERKSQQRWLHYIFTLAGRACESFMTRRTVGKILDKVDQGDGIFKVRVSHA